MKSNQFRGVHGVISISCVTLAATSLFAGCSSSGDDTINFAGSGGETAGNHSGGAGAHAGSGVGGGAEAGEAGTSVGGGSGEAGELNGTAGTGETGGTSGSAGGPTGGSSGMSGGGNSGAAAGGTAGIAGGGIGGSGTAGTGGTGTAGTGGTGNAGSGGNAGTGGGGGTSGGGTSGGGTSGGGTGGAGGAGATCGNGIVEAGEACDTADGTCSNTCTKVSNATCLTCENNGTCSDFVFNCLGPVATPFNATQQTQCNAVLSCIEASNCFDGTGTLGGTCYCGSLSLTDCQAAPFNLSTAGAPNGPCAAKIQAGLPGVTSNSAVLGGLTASAKPAGAAMQRLNCDKTADGAACLSSCGFTTGGPAFP